MSDGRPKEFPSTRLESSHPATWPSPIRDWQDDNFERQEQHSGKIGISIAGDKDRRYRGLSNEDEELVQWKRWIKMGERKSGRERWFSRLPGVHHPC